MSKFGGLFIFAVGAAIGSAVTWKLLKDRYAQIAQEEIDSVKEFYGKATHSKDDKDNTEQPAKRVELNRNKELKEYAEQTKGYGPVDYSDVFTENRNTPEEKYEGPYVIKPEEFGMKEDYDCIGYMVYEDGVVVNEAGEIMDEDDMNETVGSDAVEKLGTYEPNAVHIRNDDLKNDYEILRSFETYEEACGLNQR